MLPLPDHLISPSQLGVSPIPQLGQRVQIVTVYRQRETGVIASYTRDYPYLIWRDCDYAAPGFA